jgi:hypothetical protein
MKIMLSHARIYHWDYEETVEKMLDEYKRGRSNGNSNVIRESAKRVIGDASVTPTCVKCGRKHYNTCWGPKFESKPGYDSRPSFEPKPKFPPKTSFKGYKETGAKIKKSESARKAEHDSDGSSEVIAELKKQVESLVKNIGPSAKMARDGKQKKDQRYKESGRMVVVDDQDQEVMEDNYYDEESDGKDVGDRRIRFSFGYPQGEHARMTRLVDEPPTEEEMERYRMAPISGGGVLEPMIFEPDSDLDSDRNYVPPTATELITENRKRFLIDRSDCTTPYDLRTTIIRELDGVIEKERRDEALGRGHIPAGSHKGCFGFYRDMIYLTDRKGKLMWHLYLPEDEYFCREISVVGAFMTINKYGFHEVGFFEDVEESDLESDDDIESVDESDSITEVVADQADDSEPQEQARYAAVSVGEGVRQRRRIPTMRSIAIPTIPTRLPTVVEPSANPTVVEPSIDPTVV